MKSVGFTIRLYNSLGAAMNPRMRDLAVISSFLLFAAASLASAQCPTSSTSPIGKALRTLAYGKVQTRAPIASDHEVTRSTVNYVGTEFYEDGTTKYHYLRWNNRSASLDFTKAYLVKDDAKLMPPGTTISLGGARYCPDRIVLQYYPPDNNYSNGMDSGTISLMLASGYETWPVERIETFLYKIVSIPETAPPHALPPPATPLQLPSSYVSSQTPANQLHLNADHSFSLQEAGQTYRGTFAVNGNTLEITIPETNTKTVLTSQGSNLVDPNGQTWALQTAPALNTASPAVLRNEDVIKLAKVGIDDSIIIAKIGSSKCQFDTSVDALIQLKESGVTAAVLKAMVGAQAMSGATLTVPLPNTTPPSTSAKTVTEGPKPAAPPVPVQPPSPCAEIDYLGVIQAVTGGGQMAGTNAYGGRVRNRASYTKEVDFAWIMNGRAEMGTFRVPAGQFIDVNLGQGPAPPTNVRVVGCR